MIEPLIEDQGDLIDAKAIPEKTDNGRQDFVLIPRPAQTTNLLPSPKIAYNFKIGDTLSVTSKSGQKEHKLIGSKLTTQNVTLKKIGRLCVQFTPLDRNNSMISKEIVSEMITSGRLSYNK